jgi:glycosyltransferase involved in cell wall biosynthesis
MSKLKIAVYAVCKNEEQFVDRWMDSMGEADLVVVADTGSSDGTVEKLRARGVSVYSIKVDPWRFDSARNISMQLVPEDVNVCVCTDLDEVLEPGWRKKLENKWVPGTTRLNYMYTWNFLSDGSRGLTFWYQKIHSRHGHRWTHPVHEILHYYGPGSEVNVWDDTIQLNHYPDSSKPRSQYLKLLEMSVREEPEDDRNMHYLGREYMYYGKWDECIETLEKHLALPRAQWKDERSASMRYIATAYKEKGDHEAARNWLKKAIEEAPHMREPYVDMAQMAYTEKDWPIVYEMVEQALKIESRTASYLTQDHAWNFTPYDYGALSCYELGMYEKSYKYAKIAADMNPDCERLRNNVKLIDFKIKSLS